MNRNLATLIQTHGQQIWPFLAILAKYTLEAKYDADFVDYEKGEIDESFLKEAANSGLLRYDISGRRVRVFLRTSDQFMYSFCPGSDQTGRGSRYLASGSKPSKPGTRQRFESLSIRDVVEAVDPLAENYSHLRFQLGKLQKDFPDSTILKVAEYNRNKVTINQFLTTQVFRRLVQEYEKEKEAFSHRGTKEYSEWE